MGFLRTFIVGTHPLGDLLRGQDAGWFDHGAFAVDPLRLDGVQPRAFTRQPTRDDAHATPCLFDGAVMRSQPRSGDAPLSSSGARRALELLNSTRAPFSRAPRGGTLHAQRRAAVCASAAAGVRRALPAD
jgi:hypothetical protein